MKPRSASLRPAAPRSMKPRSATPRLLKGVAIGVVGTGQIGGSLVQRLSRLRPDITVCAFDLAASLAVKIRPFAHVCRTLDDLVRQSDVVVLAVPVQTVVRLMPRIARLAGQRRSRRRLIVCDVSTVKVTVVAAAAQHKADFDFVGLHPLAGSEGQGWDAAVAGLFDGCVVGICPAVARAGRVARELVALIGGNPVAMNPRDHDRIVAEGIGLPHILAFAAAGMRAGGGRGTPLKGRSWRSLTRVAASPPAMVAGFLHENRDNQLRVLARFRQRLNAVDRALRQSSVSGLERQLAIWQQGTRPPGGGSR